MKAEDFLAIPNSSITAVMVGGQWLRVDHVVIGDTSLTCRQPTRYRDGSLCIPYAEISAVQYG